MSPLDPVARRDRRPNDARAGKKAPTTDNLIERLAVLDLKIEALQRRIASIEPARRHPPEWQQTLDRLADAREAYSVRMTQLDSLK